MVSKVEWVVDAVLQRPTLNCSIDFDVDVVVGVGVLLFFLYPISIPKTVGTTNCGGVLYSLKSIFNTISN